MNHFRHRLLTTRRVSVWGIGYLGYTSLLRLQSKGFSADVFDFDQSRIKALAQGKYPTRWHKESWSFRGSTLGLDLSKVTPVPQIEEMFNNCLHMISFPGIEQPEGKSPLAELAEHFIKHKKELDDALIIFQSAGPPGEIQKTFINRLRTRFFNQCLNILLITVTI